MKTTYRKRFMAVITAVLLTAMLSGCGTPSVKGSLTKQQSLKFLTACQADVDAINTIIDETTVFLNDTSLDDETQIEAAITEIQSIRDELAPVMNADSEFDQSNSTVAQYNQIKQICTGNLDSVLAEMQEIIAYEVSLINAFDPISSYVSSDSNDIATVYEELGQVFSTTNERLTAINPPSFIQYMHEGLRTGMNDYLVALQAVLISADLGDPLRLNSGEYQMGVIERKITALTEEAEKGFERRQQKLKDDLTQIKALLDGIDTWASSNIHDFSESITAKASLSQMPASITDLTQKRIHCTYEAPDTIIPANYRSLDYIVFLSAWCDNGTSNVIVSVEIPEFTQRYEQKITLTRAETQIKIHPPLLEGAAQLLNSSKDAQINIKVTDADTGKVELQESRPLKIYSRYDMQWGAQDGTPYYENILAWVTPEAPEVKELLRAAADSISVISGGEITFIGGYQSVSGYDDENLAAYQAAAVMNALADTMNVKYVATPFSSSDNTMQRVATSAEVINQRSGLCIETAVTVASALQATNMHVALIILPTHAQVAVETWYGTGDYYIIETTALDDAKAGNYDYVLAYLTKDEWAQYITDYEATIIDCDLAQTLGIQSID